MNRTLQKYTSFIKVEHSLFSLPILMAGALMADHRWPSGRMFFLLMVAGISARTVALVLNRIIDREIDQLNPRTQERHIPKGIIQMWEAWVIVAVSSLVYFMTAWSISDFCLVLSWIPLLAFVSYPFFKRFTKWTHLYLGLVWSLVPLAGYLAVRSSFIGIGPVFILSAFSIFWLAGFDIIYALPDEEFDRQTGVKSLPACWGGRRALQMAALFHFAAFLSLAVMYGIFFQGPLTTMFLFMIGILFFLQHQFVQYTDFAFYYMNVIISFLVLCFVSTGIRGV